MTLSQKIDAYHKSHHHTEIETAIFENSIDCLYFGYGFNYVNIYGYDKDKARAIYNDARDFLANN